MDRVEEKAAHYLESWNANYAAVNDRSITAWMVKNVMWDITSWIEGVDPNGAKEQAGVIGWTRDEFVSLYRMLAATASFFDFPVSSQYLPDTG